LKIIFSKHAEWKFEVLRRHDVIIEREMVENALRKPDLLGRGPKGIMIVQKAVDREHLLRVIHVRKNNDIRVITFYLARRERYEDKV